MAKIIYYFILSSAVVLTSCDKRSPKMLYMPDMVDSPSVKILEDYINPPDNSVPMHAQEYPQDILVAEEQLQNPLERSKENLEKGQKLFEIYCTVCHGSDGKGKGTLTTAFPPAPDITSDLYLDRKDGFYFYRITFGAAIMPAYAHSIKVDERWQIVHYLRTLQGK